MKETLGGFVKKAVLLSTLFAILSSAAMAKSSPSLTTAQCTLKSGDQTASVSFPLDPKRPNTIYHSGEIYGLDFDIEVDCENSSGCWLLVSLNAVRAGEPGFNVASGFFDRYVPPGPLVWGRDGVNFYDYGAFDDTGSFVEGSRSFSFSCEGK